MSNFILLANKADTAQTSGGGGLILIGEFALLGLLLYFMVIRPQKKQQKKAAALLSTIQIGDSVLTASGFYGVIIDVMDEVVIIEFGNNKNCRIPTKKNAIVEVEKPNTEKKD
jgi:preprotein translocase subunit YajC